MYPVARTEDDELIVRILAAEPDAVRRYSRHLDETVIFDLRTQRGICLNAAAMLIWHSCDGETSVDAIASRLRSDLSLPADADLVWAGLESLNRAGLLKSCPPPPASLTSTVRRKLRRRMVMVAGSAFLAAIIAPTAAQAASVVCVKNANGCGGFHATCTKNTDCCSCNCNTSAGKCM